jgi:hypothetical protein
MSRDLTDIVGQAFYQGVVTAAVSLAPSAAQSAVGRIKGRRLCALAPVMAALVAIPALGEWPTLTTCHRGDHGRHFLAQLHATLSVSGLCGLTAFVASSYPTLNPVLSEHNGGMRCHWRARRRDAEDLEVLRS